MVIVSLDQLWHAVEWVSADFLDNEAYICRQTGKIYWISGDPGMIDEEKEIPEGIHDSDKYLAVPDRRDLNLGNQLVFDFVSEHLPQRNDDVQDMFRRRGAYGRFSTVFAGQYVGIRETADQILLVSFMDFDIGFFDEQENRVEPVGHNPFAPKVLPMSSV
jgi:hypothetical protein